MHNTAQRKCHSLIYYLGFEINGKVKNHNGIFVHGKCAMRSIPMGVEKSSFVETTDRNALTRP